jgi:lysophospholipase L1-like esterase
MIARSLRLLEPPSPAQRVGLLHLSMMSTIFRFARGNGLSIRSILRSGSILPIAVVFLIASSAYGRPHTQADSRWVSSWTASQQLLEPSNALDPDDLRDVTLRQIVHLSLGGTEIRLRLSNRFGSTPLHITAAHVATPISPRSDKIVASSDKGLTFSGFAQVTIPAHADYLSDPLSFPVSALSDLAVTIHMDGAPAEQTGHPGSRATSYVTHGNLVSAAELRAVKTVEHWYFVAGIDVSAPPEACAALVIGDSITDGHGATTNGNDRWTDVLAERLQASPTTREIAVLNQGIGGNRLLNDGLGPNALSRFEEDVIAPSRVRYLIVLEGINDIGMLARTGETPRAEHDALVRRVLAAYEQMIARAHSHDIKVIGATLLPFVGSSYYHPGPASEADRRAINEWIRTPGHFDTVIDFDTIMRDPVRPEILMPRFDSGDHLHPSPAGYAAMANGIPLSLFSSVAERTSNGVSLGH